MYYVDKIAQMFILTIFICLLSVWVGEVVKSPELSEICPIRIFVRGSTK